MRRILIARFAPLMVLLLGSAAPAAEPKGAMPDVVEAGRVAARLSDWQTICYFLIILVAVGTIERIVSSWQARNTAKLNADAMDRLGTAITTQGTEIKVLLTALQLQGGSYGGQGKDG